MEKLLNEEIQGQVKEFLAVMKNPMKIVAFTKETGCQTCAQTVQLAEEVAELSDKISDIHSVPRMLSDMLSPGNISYAMLIKQYQFCRWLIEKVNRYSLTSNNQQRFRYRYPLAHVFLQPTLRYD